MLFSGKSRKTRPARGVFVGAAGSAEPQAQFGTAPLGAGSAECGGPRHVIAARRSTTFKPQDPPRFCGTPGPGARRQEPMRPRAPTRAPGGCHFEGRPKRHPTVTPKSTPAHPQGATEGTTKGREGHQRSPPQLHLVNPALAGWDPKTKRNIHSSSFGPNFNNYLNYFILSFIINYLLYEKRKGESS